MRRLSTVVAMQYSGIIFDLDGTLLDTLADIARAMNRVLRSHGFAEREVPEYRSMVGWGLEELTRRALPAEHTEGSGRQNNGLVAQCYQEVVSAYAAAPVVETEPFDGVPEVLRELHEAGVPLAVLSNKHDELVTTIVAQTLGLQCFRVVGGARDGVPKKPHQEAAHRIARELGVAPEETVFVGDSGVDIETARRAGMIAAAVTWGIAPREELKSAGPDILLEQPTEILTRLKFRPHTAATQHTGANQGRTET